MSLRSEHVKIKQKNDKIFKTEVYFISFKMIYKDFSVIKLFLVPEKQTINLAKATTVHFIRHHGHGPETNYFCMLNIGTKPFLTNPVASTIKYMKWPFLELILSY